MPSWCTRLICKSFSMPINWSFRCRPRKMAVARGQFEACSQSYPQKMCIFGGVHCKPIQPPKTERQVPQQAPTTAQSKGIAPVRHDLRRPRERNATHGDLSWPRIAQAACRAIWLLVSCPVLALAPISKRCISLRTGVIRMPNWVAQVVAASASGGSPDAPPIQTVIQGLEAGHHPAGHQASSN